MPLGNRAKTDELSVTYLNQVYALGTTYVQLADEVAEGVSGVNTAIEGTLQTGERTWMFVQAATAVTAGALCKINAAATPFVVAMDNTSETLTYLLRGVADHAIAAGSYGWIIVDGTCVISAAPAGGVILGSLVASDGNVAVGSVDIFLFDPATAHATKSSISPLVAIALEAEAAGAEYGAGFVQARIANRLG